MKLFLPLLLATLAFGADAPKLTDAQKLHIRELQVPVLQLESAQLKLESQYRDATQQLQMARKALEDAAKAATPKDYELQADLSLKEAPKESKEQTKK